MHHTQEELLSLLSLTRGIFDTPGAVEVCCACTDQYTPRAVCSEEADISAKDTDSPYILEEEKQGQTKEAIVQEFAKSGSLQNLLDQISKAFTSNVQVCSLLEHKW